MHQYGSTPHNSSAVPLAIIHRIPPLWSTSINNLDGKCSPRAETDRSRRPLSLAPCTNILHCLSTCFLCTLSPFYSKLAFNWHWFWIHSRNYLFPRLPELWKQEAFWQPPLCTWRWRYNPAPELRDHMIQYTIQSWKSTQLTGQYFHGIYKQGNVVIVLLAHWKTVNNSLCYCVSTTYCHMYAGSSFWQ